MLNTPDLEKIHTLLLVAAPIVFILGTLLSHFLKSVMTLVIVIAITGFLYANYEHLGHKLALIKQYQPQITAKVVKFEHNTLPTVEQKGVAFLKKIKQQVNDSRIH